MMKLNVYFMDNPEHGTFMFIRRLRLSINGFSFSLTTNGGVGVGLRTGLFSMHVMKALKNKRTSVRF